MIIKFLGTGPSKPITDRKGKSFRLQSSILIKYKDLTFLIDCTPNVKKQLKITPDYILITHSHSDASGGLKYLSNAKLLSKKKLYLELKKKYQLKELNFVDINQLNKFDGLTIKAFEVIHSKNITTYGYQFKFMDKKIIYASDFRDIPTRNKQFFKNADIAIVDGSGWDFPVFDHQAVKDFLKKSNSWGIKKIYFTQIGRRVPEHEKAQKIISSINKNAFLAWDGLKIIIS